MINRTHFSLQRVDGDKRSLSQRLSLKAELLLATAPTIIVLSVMALVEVLSQQRLLFASLASSAFLIHFDPHHYNNTARTLILSQLMAATIGWLANCVLGAGYASGAVAMVVTIIFMIVLNLVHPPAISTSLIFAFLESSRNNLVLFSLAAGIIAFLCGLERLSLRILARFS